MAWKVGETFQADITGFAHDGYGMAISATGKRLKIMNALPGERVEASVTKRRRGLVFAVAETILHASPERVPPQDPGFLAGGMWQILDFTAENHYKRQILRELFREFPSLEIPAISYDAREYGYRNKLEFSFFGDKESGKLSLAFHRRGTKRGKIPVTGTHMATDPMNRYAQVILENLNSRGSKRDQVKFLQIRYSFYTKTVTAYLFVLDREYDWTWMPQLLDETLVGIQVIYSDPRSPVSVSSEVLVQGGDTQVTEKLLDKEFVYPGHGFFQVNVPLFATVLEDIKAYVDSCTTGQELLLDLYSGVGVIGIACAEYVNKVIGVESFPEAQLYAQHNASINQLSQFEFKEDTVESAIWEYGSKADIVILDPPRSGLHPKVIKALRSQMPAHIIYLSCNPKTQSEDVKKIADLYDITLVKGYNLYPHTPHIEHLICLKRKSTI